MFATPFERGNCVRIRHALEWRSHKRFDPGDTVLVDSVREELHVVTTFVENGLQDGLEEVLRQVCVRGQIRKCDLWLHHPEFREVAAGVAVLSTERRAERVHF